MARHGRSRADRGGGGRRDPRGRPYAQPPAPRARRVAHRARPGGQARHRARRGVAGLARALRRPHPRHGARHRGEPPALDGRAPGPHGRVPRPSHRRRRAGREARPARPGARRGPGRTARGAARPPGRGLESGRRGDGARGAPRRDPRRPREEPVTVSARSTPGGLGERVPRCAGRAWRGRAGARRRSLARPLASGAHPAARGFAASPRSGSTTPRPRSPRVCSSASPRPWTHDAGRRRGAPLGRARRPALGARRAPRGAALRHEERPVGREPHPVDPRPVAVLRGGRADRGAGARGVRRGDGRRPRDRLHGGSRAAAGALPGLRGRRRAADARIQFALENGAPAEVAAIVSEALPRDWHPRSSSPEDTRMLLGLAETLGGVGNRAFRAGVAGTSRPSPPISRCRAPAASRGAVPRRSPSWPTRGPRERRSAAPAGRSLVSTRTSSRRTASRATSARSASARSRTAPRWPSWPASDSCSLCRRAARRPLAAQRAPEQHEERARGSGRGRRLARHRRRHAPRDLPLPRERRAPLDLPAAPARRRYDRRGQRGLLGVGDPRPGARARGDPRAGHRRGRGALATRIHQRLLPPGPEGRGRSPRALPPQDRHGRGPRPLHRLPRRGHRDGSHDVAPGPAGMDRPRSAGGALPRGRPEPRDPERHRRLRAHRRRRGLAHRTRQLRGARRQLLGIIDMDGEDGRQRIAMLEDAGEDRRSSGFRSA